jgi:predicted amidohydrolase YtcJ
VDAELDRLLAASRASGIALAVHAIGDRAAAAVLDAIERAGSRRAGVRRERMEHLQLLRASDRARLASLGVTASIQPIHAAVDRDLVEACWAGRLADAYAFRSIADAGTLLAAGSDAPVESFDPWMGIYAAIHRRLPADRHGDWTPAESLSFAGALAAYTAGPANAIGAADEGHLRIGAVADLAVLDRSIHELADGDERLASARSVLTVVNGAVVHEH